MKIQIPFNVLKLSSIELNRIQLNLNSIQVVGNVIQYFHLKWNLIFTKSIQMFHRLIN
jgi:hypothetical protein